jgi:2-polyprenyl-3-methyl-5-hydroxy-6-metoxy-1,4-benzoquinol methylase
MVCSGVAFIPLGAHKGHEIFRCTTCGLCVVHPLPALEQIADIYEDYASNDLYIVKTKKKVARSRKRLKRYMHLAKGKRFIDLGCNIGTTVEAARELGLDAHGIDIDSVSVNTARKIFPAGKYHQGPLETMPADWGPFDFAFFTEVIEHIPDPHAYFEALVPRLAQGAVLYLTTPDAGHWRVPKRFTDWDQVFPPDHIIYFTKDAMTRFLDQHGFDVIRFIWSHKPALKVLARKR